MPDLLDTPLTARMYIDAGEVVRVRVEADEFYDDEPGPPKATEGVIAAQEREGRRAPYTITVGPFLASRRVTLIIVRSARLQSRDWALCHGGRMLASSQWRRSRVTAEQKVA